MATLSEAMAAAVGHHQAGALDAAEQIYRRVLEAEPTHAEAWHLLGVIHFQRGNLPAALEQIGRSIELDGNVASFHSNLGNVYQALGRLDESVASHLRAVELNPNLAEPHNNLGLALQELGRKDEAIGSFRRALAIKPDYAAAHYNLGITLKDLGQPREAIAAFRRALEIMPDFPSVYNNLGVVLQEQGQVDEAVRCLRRAVQLSPELAEAHNNLGNALRLQGDQLEAADCYRRALQLNPDFAEPHCNLGNALHEQGLRAEAAECYRRALQLQPDFVDAHFNYSLNLLTTGDLPTGWKEYEWRWQRHGFVKRNYLQPRWTGEPLAGRTILIYAEQGLGDVMQFARYTSLVKQQGGTVVVEAPQPLAGLLATCPGVDQVVTAGEALPAFDVHSPIGSLPGIFGTTLDTIPASVPYVSPPAADVEHWGRELGSQPGFKVGITWQGNPAFPQDRLRSIPLGQFLPLAAVPKVRFYSLQMGIGREQLRQLGPTAPIVDLGDQLGDFAHTAAIVRNLDLVISIDSAQVHLAGALGMPVWLPLSLAGDWRWFTDREDSPWYPTARLFRQTVLGQWSDVFERMENELKKLSSVRP